MDLVTRLESRLIEVSLTPTPAYSDAAVTLVRSALAEGARHNEALTRAAVARPTTEADAWRDVVDRLRCADSD
jgi:phage head maturation protease